MHRFHLLAVMILGSSAHALESKTFEFGLGTRYTTFKYEEELASPAKSTETATYPSLMAEARLFVMDNTYFQVSYEDAKNVNSHYDGAALSTGAPVQGTDPLSFRTIEGTFVIALGPVSGYMGYGNRKWDRFLSGGSGYREIYTWNYSSVGFQFWFSRGTPFEVAFDTCLRTTNGGKIKVITSETVSGGEDSQMSLGSRKGYRLSVPMIYHHESFAFSASPFYELSQIGESNVVTNATLAPTPGTGIQEPGSHTHQYGIEFLMTFSL